MANFKEQAKKVIMMIESEIEAHKLGRGKDGTIKQLEKIYDEVELMIKSKRYNPYYPIAIVDTWDYNSELGKQLIDLFEVYKRLR